MPRNFVTVNGTVNINSSPTSKRIQLFDTTTGLMIGSTTSSAVDGTYSTTVLKERGRSLYGVASDDYGTVWQGSVTYASNAKVIPITANGHWYLCTTAGTSSSSEPTWPTSGGTVTDGTVVWTDQGLIQNALIRGPFVVADPGGTNNVVSACRYQSNDGNTVRDLILTNRWVAPSTPIATTSTTKFGSNAIQFSGNSYLKNDLLNLTGDLTIDMWFYLPVALTGNTSVCLFSIGTLGSVSNRIQLDIYGPTQGYQVEFYRFGTSGSGSAQSTATLSANTWYYLSGERYGNTNYVYLNGNKLGTFTDSNSISFPSTAYSYLGVNCSTTTVYYSGIIGEHRISNVARYQGVSFTPPSTPMVL